MLLSVRVIPKADRDAVYGYEEAPQGLVVKARVRAVAEKGKANTALVSLIAKWLDIRKSDIVLQSGEKSRVKILSITGHDEELQTRLDEALDKLG